jgi:hypothetical protein
VFAWQFAVKDHFLGGFTSFLGGFWHSRQFGILVVTVAQGFHLIGFFNRLSV